MCACVYLQPTQALRLHQEHHIARTLDLCTRIPALRHSPLKELTRLAVHLKASSYSKGQGPLLKMPACLFVCLRATQFKLQPVAEWRRRHAESFHLPSQLQRVAALPRTA